MESPCIGELFAAEYLRGWRHRASDRYVQVQANIHTLSACADCPNQTSMTSYIIGTGLPTAMYQASSLVCTYNLRRAQGQLASSPIDPSQIILAVQALSLMISRNSPVNLIRSSQASSFKGRSQSHRAKPCGTTVGGGPRFSRVISLRSQQILTVRSVGTGTPYEVV